MSKQQISFRCYQLLILLLTPVVVLIFLLRSISQKQYRRRLKERFGWLSSNLKADGIVVHAASVGEVMAVKPFVEQLLQQFPHTPITVTTFTPTGSAQVKKMFADRVQHSYIPLDISFCVHLFFRFLKPKALVLMETELWPTLIHRAYKSDIPLLLINGRMSSKSLKSYKKLQWLITPALNKFSHILCQSQDNAEHFIEMGANSSIVCTSGNLKYDIALNDDVQAKISELAPFISTKRKLLVVGSTHQHEEQIVIDAYQQLKANHPELLLVLVPRHPERFRSVEKICQQADMSVVTRSSTLPVTSDADVWLIDTLGELLATYALADICIVAGSFGAVGGHNPLEPALFAKPIVVGTNMANFKDINAKFIAANAIVQLDDNVQLSAQLNLLLNDSKRAQQLGENALQVVVANQGATQKSITALQKLL